MRLACALLVSLLTAVSIRSEVIVYKFSTVERFVGNGEDQKRVIKGNIAVDLDTHDISLVGTSVLNTRKEMIVEFLPSTDIQTLTGAVGVVHTVIAAVEKDRQESGGATFTLTYARGANSPIQVSSNSVVSWPRKMSFSGVGITLHGNARLAAEGSGIMTFLPKETLTANNLGRSLSQVTSLLVDQLTLKGYRLVDTDYGSSDAYAEFGSTQGGTSGKWRYQQFNGTESSDLVFKPSGNISSGFQPTWAATNTDLPLIFADSTVTNALVFHPGIPSSGPQPSRHDISLTWIAPASGYYAIRGLVRGDNRIGSGGNGFHFSISTSDSVAGSLDVQFDDKTDHSISVPYVYVEGGAPLWFRVYDGGNNEYDYGAFNFYIAPTFSRFLGFAPLP